MNYRLLIAGAAIVALNQGCGSDMNFESHSSSGEFERAVFMPNPTPTPTTTIQDPVAMPTPTPTPSPTPPVVNDLGKCVPAPAEYYSTYTVSTCAERKAVKDLMMIQVNRYGSWLCVEINGVKYSWIKYVGEAQTCGVGY